MYIFCRRHLIIFLDPNYTFLWKSGKETKRLVACLAERHLSVSELKLPPTVSHKINYDNAFLCPFVIVMNGCLSGGKNTHKTHREAEKHTFL